jgi:hypothetical protein
VDVLDEELPETPLEELGIKELTEGIFMGLPILSAFCCKFYAGTLESFSALSQFNSEGFGPIRLNREKDAGQKLSPRRG